MHRVIINFVVERFKKTIAIENTPDGSIPTEIVYDLRSKFVNTSKIFEIEKTRVET